MVIPIWTDIAISGRACGGGAPRKHAEFSYKDGTMCVEHSSRLERNFACGHRGCGNTQAVHARTVAGPHGLSKLTL